MAINNMNKKIRGYNASLIVLDVLANCKEDTEVNAFNFVAKQTANHVDNQVTKLIDDASKGIGNFKLVTPSNSPKTKTIRKPKTKKQKKWKK